MPTAQQVRKPVERSLRSVSLTELQREQLKISETRYPTQERWAAAFGMNRASLCRILQLGKGSEANIKKVQQKLKSVKVGLQKV